MSTKSPSSPISYMVNFQDLANYGFSLVEDVNIDGHLPKMCDDYKPTLDKNIEAQRQVYKNKFENKSIDYKSKVMKTFCRNGIPPELRGELWFHISGADKLKQESPTLYSDLKKNHNSKEVSEAVKQIDNDIDRTFPEQVFYALDESKTALRNILVAYSLYNKQVGYCQSMNFLAAILHIHMGEENAFYTLVQMLKHQSYLPPTLFDPTLDGLYCETFVLDKLAEKRLSKIYLHLKKLDINFVLFTTKWFMLLYINVFPMETSLRIWDTFFFEGYKVLFRVGLAFLSMHEDQILKMSQMGDLLQAMNAWGKEMFDCNTLLTKSFNIPRFGRKNIQALRQEYHTQKKEK